MSVTTKNFADRLSDLISESGKGVKQLSEDIGISTGAISKYQNDASTPGADAVVKIAKYFNVTSDWLLGLTNVKTPDGDVRRVCDYTGLTEDVVGRLHNTIATDKKFWLAGAFLNHLIALLNLEKIGDSFDNMGMVFMNSLDAVADEILQGKKPLGEIKHILTKQPQVISGGMVKLSPQAAYEFLMNQVSDELKAAGGKATDTLASALMYASYKDMDDETTKSRPSATNTETANDQD